MFNSGDVPIVAHDAHRRRIEEKKRSILNSESKPDRNKRPQKVSVREQRHVTLYRTHLFKDSIDPGLHLLGAFPTGTTICKNQP